MDYALKYDVYELNKKLFRFDYFDSCFLIEKTIYSYFNKYKDKTNKECFLNELLNRIHQHPHTFYQQRVMRSINRFFTRQKRNKVFPNTVLLPLKYSEKDFCWKAKKESWIDYLKKKDKLTMVLNQKPYETIERDRRIIIKPVI